MSIHDMRVGPCACGAWHTSDEAKAPEVVNGEAANNGLETCSCHEAKSDPVYCDAPSIKESLRTAALVFLKVVPSRLVRDPSADITSTLLLASVMACKPVHV